MTNLRNLGPQFQRLYHGTLDVAAEAIDTEGIHPGEMGAVYATTKPEHAEQWARKRMADNPQYAGRVVEFAGHEDDITPAAREGEVMHWGHVPVERIGDIYEVEEQD